MPANRLIAGMARSKWFCGCQDERRSVVTMKGHYP